MTLTWKVTKAISSFGVIPELWFFWIDGVIVGRIFFHRERMYIADNACSGLYDLDQTTITYAELECAIAELDDDRLPERNDGLDKETNRPLGCPFQHPVRVAN